MQLKGIPYVAGQAQGSLQWGLQDDNSGTIVLLSERELCPFTNPPAGLVVIDGAPFGHAMIPLLGLGLPTMIIDRSLTSALRNGTRVWLDGERGMLADKPLPDYPEIQRSIPSNQTIDGERIHLRVSTRDVPAANQAATNGAEAIGLVRSEFLIPGEAALPDRAFYRQAFGSICRAASPLPVIIRLLDLAADKLPAWLPELEDVIGVLGLQGVRLFAYEPVRNVYLAQLNAIDQLSDRFDIRVLIPYLGSLAELCEWCERIRDQLHRPLPIGAMAETPATALQVAEWLQQVDFVALGCNDLMQCLFGADRSRTELSPYLDPYAPALYRFLRLVAESVPEQRDRLQLCGVLPQLPGILPLLLGLGFRVFSVEASSLDYLRRTIAGTSLAQARELVSRVCRAHDSAQVRALLDPT
jgi:phosphoenolpyruvate-protein kinase (PTS system EI component)